MNYAVKDFKKMARIQLDGKFGVFILAQVVVSLISSAIAMFPSRSVWVNLLIVVITTLITSVLTFGLSYMSLMNARNKMFTVSDLFYGFKHHPDRMILLQLLLMAISFACLVPGYVLLILGTLMEGQSSSFILLLAGVVLLVAGTVLLVYFSLGFSQALFLMADSNDMGPLESLKQSKRMMKGHKGKFLYLGLSFFGMLLLGILSFGIGTLWIQPYMLMTQANFYRSLTGELNPAAGPQQQSFESMNTPDGNAPYYTHLSEEFQDEFRK